MYSLNLGASIIANRGFSQILIIIVRLSLLTMTNLNHMREMLLFVRSKIAD